MAETVQNFRTILESTGGNNVGIVVPDEVVAAFERGKRVPVSVTVNGSYTYSSSIASMGGRFLISFNAATRSATGLGAGDTIDVQVEVDDAPRTVDVPAALGKALNSSRSATTAWQALSPSKQKVHALSVESAKTDETRERRVAKVIETLES